MTREKPPKPYVDFPLYSHANGQWAKKIRGKTRFFGSWDDWRAALKLYEQTKDVIGPDVFDLDDLCNLFLAAKKRAADSGEIKLDTWKEYKRVCAQCLAILGRTVPLDDLSPRHFVALREQLAIEIESPVTLRNIIVKLRALFAWAYDAGHADKPLRYREALKRPPLAKLRKAKETRQKNLFSHKEICALISAANPWMKAAIMLAINGGLGNRDICEIEWSHINGDWVEMSREKTAVHRRFLLWPETKAALVRNESRWIFCGERGQQLGQGSSNATPISAMFRELMTTAGIDVDEDGKPIKGKKGRGFYTLRHTYRTIADGAKDRTAVRYTMGHADSSIDAEYVEGIDEARLKAVSDLVRAWFKQNAQSQ